MEIWKANPDRPGTVIFDQQRVAQDIFKELEAHLKADGRMPDEYFLLSSKWENGALFPRNAEILCNANFGGSEGIYLDISVQYQKEVPEFNGVTFATENVQRNVTERFATGKTLGETIEDLDKMNLVASSVTAAFYGMAREVKERYAQIEAKNQQAQESPRVKQVATALKSEKPQSHEGKETILMERLNKNLADYYEEVEGLDNREIIEMAADITAMANAHSYLTSYHDYDKHELEYLLEFQNPLKVLADEWRDRNIDLSDVSYAMEHIYQNSDVLLEKYPVIHHLEAIADTTLRRYMNIDLKHHLGSITKEVLIHHQKDWEIDKKALQRAALSDNPEEKRLFWHVCGFGTHLANERDTFIKDTLAHNTMTEYRANDTDMFGFYIEVTGIDDNGNVKGNVFEIGDYAKFAGHLRDVSEPLESLTLIYSDAWGENAGKVVNVTRREYDDDRHRLMSKSGNVIEKVYHPGDKVRLAALITKERTDRMALPVADVDELLQRMMDKLSDIRNPPEKSEQAITEPKKTRSLAEKMQAANEQVRAQDTQNNNARPKKIEER